MPIDAKNIPAKACTLSSGKFELRANGSDSKSRPVTLLARTNEPIEHWYWGNVVHDFAGMRLVKDRIAIDYCHDSKDILGYANKHETGAEGLVLSGALVPWKESDRASEVAFKFDNGVPYEASIDFGGEGIKYEFVDDGQVAFANDREYQGPLVIIREWPLKGVAICPHGADEHTAAQFAAAETFTAEQLNTKIGELAMPENANQAVETEETAAEVTEEVTVETAEVEADEQETAAQVLAVDPAQFARIEACFSLAVARDICINGKDIIEAAGAAFAAKENECKQLSAQVAELTAALSAKQGGTPVKRSETTAPGKKSIWK